MTVEKSILNHLKLLSVPTHFGGVNFEISPQFPLPIGSSQN